MLCSSGLMDDRDKLIYALFIKATMCLEVILSLLINNGIDNSVSQTQGNKHPGHSSPLHGRVESIPLTHSRGSEVPFFFSLLAYSMVMHMLHLCIDLSQGYRTNYRPRVSMTCICITWGRVGKVIGNSFMAFVLNCILGFAIIVRQVLAFALVSSSS